MKKLLSIILSLTMALSFATMLPISAAWIDVETNEPVVQGTIDWNDIYECEKPGSEAEGYSTEASAVNGGGKTLGQLMQQFPHGKYWNHTGGVANNNPNGVTSNPCTHHHKNCGDTNGDYTGWCGCNSYNGYQAIQCMGFAYQLAHLYYGGNPYDNDAASGFKYVSRLKNGEAAAYAALDKLKPGDVVIINDAKGDLYHVFFVYEVNGNNVTYVDCNSEGNCIIKWGQTTTKSEIKSRLRGIDVAPCALTATEQCTCSESYAGTYKVVSEIGLNIRSGHGTSFSVIGTIPNNATVNVTKSDGTWAHVEYNGVTGYSHMEYLTKVTNDNLGTKGIDIDTFNAKLSEFQSNVFKQGSTYNDDGSVGGRECFGFANYIAKYIYGSYPANWADGTLKGNIYHADWTVTYGGDAVDNLHVGDIVRFNFGGIDHSIFVTGVNGDEIYYADANREQAVHGKNYICYNRHDITKSDLKRMVALEQAEINKTNWVNKYGWVAHYKFWNEPPALKSTAKFKDNTYEYYKCSNVSWSEANAFANSKGGHLVTLTSKEENDFVSSKNTVGYFWIGATDKDTEGVWKWVTGESFAFNNWKAGEPNNLDNEDYAMCYEDGYWNDAVENWFKVTGFIVEYDVHTHYFTDDWQSDDTTHWHECSCGEKSNVEAHVWNNGTVIKQPTCTVTGEKTFTCTICGATKTESIPAKGHTPGAAATCTTPQKCTVCGTQLAAALGHNYTGSNWDSNHPHAEYQLCTRCNARKDTGKTRKDNNCPLCNGGNTWEPGDFDGDGVVTMKDAVYYIGWIGAPFLPQYQINHDVNLDFNKDGKYTMADAVYFIGWIGAPFLPQYKIEW